MTKRRKRLEPGDMVVLTHLPPGLIDNLPMEDQRAISAAVGKPIRLNEYRRDDGKAELEFKSPDGTIHFVYVSEDYLESAK